MENKTVCTDSLSRGSDTFTPDRLADILENERFFYGHNTQAGTRVNGGVIYRPTEIRAELNTDYFQYENLNGGLRCYGNQGARLRATEFCRQFYGHDYPVSIAAADLDATFSKLFIFKFEPLEKSREFIQQACSLLERLPAWPPELIDTPVSIPLEYRASSKAYKAQKDARLWEQLQVTTYVSKTVLRAALSVIMDQGVRNSLLDMINIIATLLEFVSRLASTITDKETKWRSFIVRAFLWTTWQRCQLIYFHAAATKVLVYGSSDGKIGKLALHGTMPSPNATLHEISRLYAALDKPRYMCGWSFEMLRTNTVCIGADFRRFFQRYSTAFGNYSARCLVGKSHACRGDNPQSCQRFHGMVIKDQSAHDQSCSGDCRQLIWDEASYRSLSGARAVCLMLKNGSANEFIQYCDASDQTLAISHVWSHGQGGRPETGFNYCLHQRYSQIARSLNCDSYWIDAACIPDNHQLRNEAIVNINRTFMNAKIMLVCDKDVMKLDVSNITTSICEILLITIVVSDWNCRAWTFFEAFRARRTIHLLCQNNAVVSLKQVIKNVCQNGLLEFGALCLAMPHFLPPLDDSILAQDKSGGSRPYYQAGYLPIETSSNLLNHRPASRPGDDVVIWSLLMSESTVFNNAEAFWQAAQGPIFERSEITGRILHQGVSIRTGYLVSNAPRLKTKGLSWAPSSPTFRFSSRSDTDDFNGYDGGNSESGFISPDGLVANWFLWKFNITTFLQASSNDNFLRNLSNIITRFLQGFRWGAILHPIKEDGYNTGSGPCSENYPRNLSSIITQFLQGFRWGAILRPIEEDGYNTGSGPWWEDGGRLRRAVVVVCGSNDVDGAVGEKYTFDSTEPTKPKWIKHSNVMGWEWRGVYAWDEEESLPQMKKAKNFLIV